LDPLLASYRDQFRQEQRAMIFSAERRAFALSTIGETTLS
jgi:hypothetical protein